MELAIERTARMAEPERQTMAEDLVAAESMLVAYREWADPRPELVDDHAAWKVLLRMAYDRFGRDHPESLFWVLHGLRCLGTGLVRDAHGWKLTAGQHDDYASDREKYLVKFRAELIILLGNLGESMEANRGV